MPSHLRLWNNPLQDCPAYQILILRIYPSALKRVFKHKLFQCKLNDPEVSAAAERIYEQLSEAGIDTFIDDRDERPGIKFKDADLLGFPFRITVGKRFKEKAMVEIRCRQDGTSEDIGIDDIVSHISAKLAN